MVSNSVNGSVHFRDKSRYIERGGHEAYALIAYRPTANGFSHGSGGGRSL